MSRMHPTLAAASTMPYEMALIQNMLMPKDTR
jgi:hypothetical protein